MSSRDERIKRLADFDVGQMAQDYRDFAKMVTPDDWWHSSAPSKPNNEQQPSATKPESQKFDANAATAYNTKTEQYYKKHEPEIKQVLGTSADWKSPEFAQAVYDWQSKNGFTGKWVDGKFGPATMGKVAQGHPGLANQYDIYGPYRDQHANEKPYKRVINLTQRVDQIRKEMGATDIPLPMLMGWIQVESGGRVTDKTNLGEAGLFQVSPAEAKTLNLDMNQVGSNEDYSIRAGIQLARHHSEELDKTLAQHPRLQSNFRKGTDMYWRLAMLSFSMGDGAVAKLVSAMDASGQTFENWDAVMKFAAANPHGYGPSPIKWTYHINRAFNLGNQIVNPKAVVSSAVAMRIKNAKRKARKIILDGLE